MEINNESKSSLILVFEWREIIIIIIVIIIIIIIIIIVIIILYLPTCHLGAESSFKRKRETNYKS